jgi:Tfp pilus assembly protein PilO
MAIRDYRFENLPRSTQIAIFTVLMVALAVVFYIYYLQDFVKENDKLQSEIARLETTVSQGTAIEGRLKQFRQEVEQLDKYLDTLKAILPAEKETPTVLRSVQQMAASSNLKIDKFTPQPVVPRDYYSDWPIKIEVAGNYDGLGTFFEKISQSTRIINVDSITIAGLDKEKDLNPSRTLTANCTATTFVYIEDQASNSSGEEDKDKDKAKGKNSNKNANKNANKDANKNKNKGVKK